MPEGKYYFSNFIEAGTEAQWYETVSRSVVSNSLQLQISMWINTSKQVTEVVYGVPRPQAQICQIPKLLLFFFFQCPQR